MVIRPADHGIFASSAGGVTGFGLLAGGYSTGSDIVQQWLFPIDTCSTLTTTMDATGRMSGAPWSNQGVKGYVAGGTLTVAPYTNYDSIWQIDLTNFTGSTNSSTLSGQCSYGASSSNSGSFGYAYSVYNGSSRIGTDKFIFATDTVSALTDMSVVRTYYGGISNNGVAGYPGSGNADLSIDKYLYSNDSRTTLAGTVSVSSHPEGASNADTAGYFAGGAWTDDIDKVAFPSDTVSVLTAALVGDMYGMCGMSDQDVALYWATGNLDGSGYQTGAQKMAVPAETVSTTASVTDSSYNRLYDNGISNSAGMQP